MTIIAHLRGQKIMSKILSNDPEMCFAALKLIEQLYHDGQLPAHIFRNILTDYTDVVDLSKFKVAKEAEK